MSISVIFERLYINSILSIFNSKQYLHNRCLHHVIKSNLNIEKLPSELIELIKIYRCYLRMKEAIRLKYITGEIKHKYHANFLARHIKNSMNGQVEESINQLRDKIIKIASDHGTVSPVNIDLFRVSDVKNPIELSKQINLFLSQSSDNNFKAILLLGKDLWICYSLKLKGIKENGLFFK